VKIVVDTNIIFSALLNTDGKIGDLLFNSVGIFEFYSCNYMHVEIQNHWKKLIQISKLSDKQMEEAWFKLHGKINFINEEFIPAKIWLLSEKIVSGIDVDDIDFIALTKYLNGHLWTGDKKLYNGLHKLKFNRVFNTTEMFELRNYNS
jgi:predicted nucleic acid-binding protein